MEQSSKPENSDVIDKWKSLCNKRSFNEFVKFTEEILREDNPDLMVPAKLIFLRQSLLKKEAKKILPFFNSKHPSFVGTPGRYRDCYVLVLLDCINALFSPGFIAFRNYIRYTLNYTLQDILNGDEIFYAYLYLCGTMINEKNHIIGYDDHTIRFFKITALDEICDLLNIDPWDWRFDKKLEYRMIAEYYNYLEPGNKQLEEYLNIIGKYYSIKKDYDRSNPHPPFSVAISDDDRNFLTDIIFDKDVKVHEDDLLKPIVPVQVYDNNRPLYEMIYPKPFVSEEYNQSLIKFFRRNVRGELNPQLFVDDIQNIWSYHLWPTSVVSLVLFDSQGDARLFNGPSRFNNPRAIEDWDLNNDSSLASHVIREHRDILFFVVPRIWIAPTYGMFRIPCDYSKLVDYHSQIVKSELSELSLYTNDIDLGLVTNNNVCFATNDYQIDSAVLVPLKYNNQLKGILLVGAKYVDCFISSAIPPYMIKYTEQLTKMAGNIIGACYRIKTDEQ